MRKVLNTLIKRNEKISFVESMTGGGLSADFVKNKGASKALELALIVYSNDQKINLLGVHKDTIKTFGVVSVETSEEMVKKLKLISKADLNISTTGFADGVDFPHCFVGISYKNEIKSYKIELKSTNSRIKNINLCIKEIIKLIKITLA